MSSEKKCCTPATAEWMAPRSGRSAALLRFWVALLMALVSSVQATEWYASPDADRATGVGTINQPWPLSTALDRLTPIGAGDTLWLRGGIYRSNYLSYLEGAPGQYITVRPYPNEHVLFDGSPLFPEAFPLTIDGQWTIYRDFEVVHSVNWTNSASPVAIQCIGSNVKLVNLVIHDVGQGVGFWKEAIDSEIYGCIIYYSGNTPLDHGIYTQNDVGTKRIRDSILFHGSGYGLHAYAQNGFSRGYDIEGNILFNNGSDNGEIFIGSFHPGDRLNLAGNLIFAHTNLSGPAVSITDRDHSSNPNGIATVTGNHIVGGSGFTGQDFRDLTFRDNLVWNPHRQTHTRPPPGTPIDTYDWDDNRYFGASVFAIGTTNYNFADWQAASGLDNGSSHDPGAPTGMDLFIRPNQFDPKRAHIAVYNWDLADNVSVDVSGILAVGDRYRVRNVHDYFGPPVITNVFDGAPITLPLTNLAVAAPGRPLAPPPHTGPLFAVFVVEAVYVAPSSLIASWGLDERTGTNVNDPVNGHDGFFGGGPSWINGKTGGAVNFDGINDYIEVPDHPQLNLTNDLTISFWFSPAVEFNNTSGRKDIITKVLSYWFLLNYPFSDGRLAFGFNDGTPVPHNGTPIVHTTTSVWDPNLWHHIVGTFNGTEMKIYVNGVLEGTSATSTRVRNTSFPLQFGGNTPQMLFFDGALDQIRLYNYAISSQHVLNLYNNTAPNQPPQMSPVADKVLSEGGTLSFYASALDQDDQHNPLTFYLLDGAPAGAVIHPNTGHFTWTPSDLQGGTTNTITLLVVDNDSPPLTDTTSLTIIVRKANQPPLFPPIAGQTVAEGETLILSNLATDPDLPPDPLTFSLGPGAPEGVEMTSAVGGSLIWTPAESQGPFTHLITIRAADNGTPSLSVTQSFNVTVTEVPTAPQLAPIPDRTNLLGQLLEFTVAATDADQPPDELSFALTPGSPAGAEIDPATGRFFWTPISPGTHLVGITVTDDGTPGLSAAQTFSVTVVPGGPPGLAHITNRVTAEGAPLLLTAVATGYPLSALTFGLAGSPPVGAGVDPETGLFSWTPTEAQGPGTNDIHLRVFLSEVPSLSATQTFRVVVTEVPTAPALQFIAPKQVMEGSLLSFSPAAFDVDIPANVLSFGLAPGAPEGAAVNPVTGAFTWTPAEAQGPSSNVLAVIVSDNNVPPLTALQSFTVIVQESPSAPQLAPIPNQLVLDGSELTFPATANDPDIPANSLLFALSPGAPEGATIDPSTGRFRWVPSNAAGIHRVTIHVADDTVPPLATLQELTISVVNVPVIHLASLVDGQLTLGWNASEGASYLIRYQEDPAGSNWATHPDVIVAAGPTASVTFPVTGASARFYQVVAIP